ncbi:hypothetical protein Tco_1031449 [Tanacetum coccineum]|uniref:Uncharacterized protein n=1 Tax=Tanacetum coccineum TaxID=301880 RepID=A0ABQ5G909_9ASTR
MVKGNKVVVQQEVDESNDNINAEMKGKHYGTYLFKKIDTIKLVLPLLSGTEKLIENLSQEKDSQEDALGEFNSIMDKIIEKLSEEKDSPDDFYGFLYDTDDDDDDASISEVAEKVFFKAVVYEEVVEMASNQDEALFDQEVADDSLDDEEAELERPSKRIRVT